MHGVSSFSLYLYYPAPRQPVDTSAANPVGHSQILAPLSVAIPVTPSPPENSLHLVSYTLHSARITITVTITITINITINVTITTITELMSL